MRYNFEFLRDKIYDSKDLGMSDRLSSNKNRNWNYNTGIMNCILLLGADFSKENLLDNFYNEDYWYT